VTQCPIKLLFRLLATHAPAAQQMLIFLPPTSKLPTVLKYPVPSSYHEEKDDSREVLCVRALIRLQRALSWRELT